MHHLASLMLSIFFQAVPTSKTPFQIAPECTIFSSFFQFFFGSSFQIAPECNSLRPCFFPFFQEHRFKQRQNVPYIVLDFKMSSAVPASQKINSYSVKLHYLQSLIAFNIILSFSTSKKHRSNAQECTFGVLSFKTSSAGSASFGLQVSALGNEQTQGHL